MKLAIWLEGRMSRKIVELEIFSSCSAAFGSRRKAGRRKSLIHMGKRTARINSPGEEREYEMTMGKGREETRRSLSKRCSEVFANVSFHHSSPQLLLPLRQPGADYGDRRASQVHLVRILARTEKERTKERRIF